MKLALCLILLVDTSGSIDASEYELQTRGTAQALLAEPVLRAVERGGMAVSYVTWSSDAYVDIPWTVITTRGEMREFSARLEASPRSNNGSTNLSAGFDMAARLMVQSPSCSRYVVDVSSDGKQNVPGDPRTSLTPLLALNAQVNAIVIEDEVGVLDYYKELIEPDGFVMPATFESYAAAIRAKLTLEVSDAKEIVSK